MKRCRTLHRMGVLALLAPVLAAQGVDVTKLAPLDVDGDGSPELRALRMLEVAGREDAPRVLVLVEKRLVSARDGVAAEAIVRLRARLARFAADLAGDGYRAQVLLSELGSARDGMLVLGMRRFLQQVAERVDLAGVVLVGHFPDAKLVRTCNWRRADRASLPGRDGKKHEIRKGTRWLRRIPELVAHKCELVLADLDGNWRELYVGPARALQRVEASFVDADAIARGGVCAALRVGTKTYGDVFHVDDGRVAVDKASFTVEIDDTQRDRECTERDRARENALAQPEIAISRIDARGVAWSPRAEYLGKGGEPRAVTTVAGQKAPRWERIWEPDAALELRLLCEYFDRNHAYRKHGVRANAHKPAAIAWGLASGMRILRKAQPAWERFREPGYDVRKGADLRALLAWFQRPATLRTMRAHSNPYHAVFQKTDIAALERDLGGVSWAYAARGSRLEASLRTACAKGRAGFAYYRSLWEHELATRAPYIMIHTGCEALSPPQHKLGYEDPRYGARAHAESLLFYTPCVALVGRAKVFYDEPRGFVERLREGGTVGDAWRAYFAIEARAESWRRVGGDIGRKRSYFWSVIGDWTLRMPRVQDSR